MKKLAVVLAVVGLLVVMVGPVLAAVVWEWHTGESCILTWFSWEDPELWSCNEGPPLGGSIYVTDSGAFSTMGVEIPSGSTIDYQAGNECPDFTVMTYSQYEWGGTPIQTLTEFPAIITGFPENGVIRLVGSDCVITDITINYDNGGSVTGEILTGFNVSEIFTIAGTLVSAMFNVIAVIAGVYLAFKLVQIIISKFRG